MESPVVVETANYDVTSTTSIPEPIIGEYQGISETSNDIPPNVWIGELTYSDADPNMRFMLTYDLSLWELVPDEKTVTGYYNLVYRTNPNCTIVPSVGFGVGPDLHVENKEIKAGEFTYLAHQVKDQANELLATNY